MQSDEERRAKARVRAAKSRAKKKVEKQAAEASQRDARDGSNPSAPTVMQDAVEEALAAMKWITASDRAAVMQVRRLAALVDLLEASGDWIRALSAHRALTSALTALGGNPIVRQQHELRSLRAVSRNGGDDDGEHEGETTAEGGIVTKFERPAKRSRR